ncbi:hypothetical protein Lal_00034691 [Lupinus albus]|nr:hypothetical protein Lal_00034691 [Lupinus albus]
MSWNAFYVNLLDESKFRPPPPLIDFEGLEELMMLQQKPVCAPAMIKRKTVKKINVARFYSLHTVNVGGTVLLLA